MYHFFKDNDVLLTEVNGSKYKYLGFDKETGYVNFEYHFKFKGQHFKRHYSFYAMPNRQKTEYYKELSIRVLKDHKNGRIKRQIEFEFDPTRKRKVIVPIVAFLLVAGGAGGALYALKDTIWGGGGTVKTYSVTYDCKGGSLQGEEKKTITEESTIQTGPNPTKDNYLFAGWFKEDTYQNKVTFPYKITADSVLYAKWKPSASLSYNVYFDTNNEDCTIPSLTVHAGDILSKYGLSEPTKKDYKFDAWYYDNETFKDKVDLNSPIEKDITLYAKYKKTAFTVTFDTNGGEKPSGTTPVSGETDKYAMSSLSSLSIEPFSQKKVDGSYIAFEGWMDKNNDLISYPYTINNDDVTLKAKWDSSKTTHTASFLKNYSDTVPFKTINNVRYIKTPPTVRDIVDADPNYRLTGWYDKDDIDKKPIDFSGTGYELLDKDVQFVAIWERITHEVKLFTIVDGVKTLKETRQCAVINKDPNFVVEDCDLVGWYTDEACTSEKINFNKGVTIENDCAFYAKYDRTHFDVEYIDDDNSSTIVSLKHIEKINEGDLPYVKKVNHMVTWTINGLKIGEDISFPIYVKDYLPKGETKLTIKANWTQNSYYLTLRYPTLDETLIHEDVKLDSQKVVKMENLNKYKFSGSTEQHKAHKCIGWSRTEGGEIISDTSITLENDTILYAKYELREFNVTLKFQDKTSGDELSPDQIIRMDYGNHKTEDLSNKIPTITDHPFERWVYENKSLVYSSFDVTSDLTLIAQFDKEYTVRVRYTLDPTDWTTREEKVLTKQKVVHFNDILQYVPDDVKNGTVYKLWNEVEYRGVKWQVYKSKGDTTGISADSFTITDDYIYQGECVFRIIFKKCAYNVTFNDGDKGILTIPNKQNGSVIKPSEVPVLNDSEDKIFNGWTRSDRSYEGVINFNKDYEFNASSDVTFNACWNTDTTVTFKIADEDYNNGIAHFKKGEEKTNSVASTGQKISATSYKDISGYDLVINELPGKQYVQDGWYTLEGSWWSRQKVRFDSFPVKNARTDLVLYANFVESTSKVSLLLDSGKGKFSDGTTQIIMSPEYKTKLADLKKNTKYKEPVLKDFKFSNWSIYDAKEGKYVELDDNFEFTGNSYLHPIFKEDIRKPTNFATDNWATFATVAENKVTDANGNAYANGYEALKNIYNTEYKREDTNTGKVKNSFIGSTRTMVMDGCSQSSFTVKVIGENHDKITGSTNKAALTFMTTTAPYTDIYNPSLHAGVSNNWGSSSIRVSLMKQSDGSEGTSYSLIETTLKNHAQYVDKYTRYGTKDTTKYNNKDTTSDQFFLFSGTELGLVNTDAAKEKYNNNLDSKKYSANEGTKYVGLSNTASVLKRVYYNPLTEKNEAIEWYLRSPYNHEHCFKDNKYYKGVLGSAINRITDKGTFRYSSTWVKEIDAYYGDTYRGVVFGFAIGVGK